MPDMNPCDVLIVGAGPVGLTLAIDLAWRGIKVTSPKRAHRAAASGAEVQSCRGPHHGDLPPSRHRRKGARCGFAARLPARHQLPHDLHRQELTRIPIPCRRDRFTDTEGPTAIGRRRSRRIGSTRFSSSRSCSRMRQASRASKFSTGRKSRMWRSRMSPRRVTLRDLDSGAVAALDIPLCDWLRRRAVRRAQGDRRDTARRCRDPARAVDALSARRT